MLNTNTDLICRCGTEYRRLKYRNMSNEHITRMLCPRCDSSEIHRLEGVLAECGWTPCEAPIRGDFYDRAEVYTRFIIGTVLISVAAIAAFEILRFYGLWS